MSSQGLNYTICLRFVFKNLGPSRWVKVERCSYTYALTLFFDFLVSGIFNCKVIPYFPRISSFRADRSAANHHNRYVNNWTRNDCYIHGTNAMLLHLFCDVHLTIWVSLFFVEAIPFFSWLLFHYLSLYGQILFLHEFGMNLSFPLSYSATCTTMDILVMLKVAMLSTILVDLTEPYSHASCYRHLKRSSQSPGK